MGNGPIASVFRSGVARSSRRRRSLVNCVLVLRPGEPDAVAAAQLTAGQSRYRGKVTEQIGGPIGKKPRLVAESEHVCAPTAASDCALER
jgi:hypothetical protein